MKLEKLVIRDLRALRARDDTLLAPDGELRRPPPFDTLLALFHGPASTPR